MKISKTVLSKSIKRRSRADTLPSKLDSNSFELPFLNNELSPSLKRKSISNEKLRGFGKQQTCDYVEKVLKNWKYTNESNKDLELKHIYEGNKLINFLESENDNMCNGEVLTNTLPKLIKSSESEYSSCKSDTSSLMTREPTPDKPIKELVLDSKNTFIYEVNNVGNNLFDIFNLLYKTKSISFITIDIENLKINFKPKSIQDKDVLDIKEALKSKYPLVSFNKKEINRNNDIYQCNEHDKISVQDQKINLNDIEQKCLNNVEYQSVSLELCKKSKSTIQKYKEDQNVESVKNKIYIKYAQSFPPIIPLNNTKFEGSRLKDIRRILETEKRTEYVFFQIKDHITDLCSDYIGNVIIQKMMEYGTKEQRTFIIKQVSPYMAQIGIHKNGTWAIQKIVEYADTVEEIEYIVNGIKNYTPLLLLDQYGNYVIQGCLKFGPQKNQFIFDAIESQNLYISTGKFGARAIRTCLDSQYTTNQQRRSVVDAISKNSYYLSLNQNGSILINWIIDQYKYNLNNVIMEMKDYIKEIVQNVWGCNIVLKLLTQTQDHNSRDLLIYYLFFDQSNNTNDESLIKFAKDDLSGKDDICKKILSCLNYNIKLRKAIELKLDTVKRILIEKDYEI